MEKIFILILVGLLVMISVVSGLSGAECNYCNPSPGAPCDLWCWCQYNPGAFACQQQQGSESQDSSTIVCGNGIKEGDEQCDGPDLAGKICRDFTINYGFYSKIFVGGELSCNSDCTFNTIKCHNCGDGVLDLSEQCDGNDFFPLPYTDEDGNRVDARDCVSYNYLNNERDRYGYYFLSRIDEFVSGTVGCYPQGHEKQCKPDFSNCVLAPACCTYKLNIWDQNPYTQEFQWVDTLLFRYKKSANGRCDMEGDKISSDSCESPEVFYTLPDDEGQWRLIYGACYHESDCPDNFGPLSSTTITGNTILGRIILNLKENIRFIGNIIKDIFS